MVRLPPTTPFTLQITPVFEAPVTVAAYCDEFPNVMLVAPLKLRVTVGGGGAGAASLTSRLRETDASAILVAVIVTVEESGDVAGAV